MVGFTGSRNLSTHHRAQVSAIVQHYAQHGHALATGCALGADLFVRTAAPGCKVFSAAAQPSNLPPRVRFAKRSAAMVRAVSLGPSPLIVGFPAGACPAGVRPRSSFLGKGSGTWGTLALAAGLGIPVIVFWLASGPPALPMWGNWQAVVVGQFVGFSLSPAGTQPTLF